VLCLQNELHLRRFETGGWEQMNKKKTEKDFHFTEFISYVMETDTDTLLFFSHNILEALEVTLIKKK
jgi:hypothetical protein